MPLFKAMRCKGLTKRFSCGVSGMYKCNVEKIKKIVAEQNRWRSFSINLIASENVLSNRGRAIMGSDFAH